MEIYLIRHGETQWNREHKLQGMTDIPLNDVGLAEARKASRQNRDLAFDCVLSSPLVRAKKTAEILRGERTAPLRIEPLLREISFGEGEGVDLSAEDEEGRALREKLRVFFQNPGHYEPLPGGESIHALKERGRRVLEEVLLPLEEEFGDGRVLVVAHGAILRAILDILQDIPEEDFWAGKLLPNCGGAILTLSEGRFSVKEASIDLVYPEESREGLGGDFR